MLTRLPILPARPRSSSRRRFTLLSSLLLERLAMKTRLTSILAVLVLFLLCPFVLTAAEYSIGTGGDYANLESLRLAGVLQSGDTILLPGDVHYWGDSSLRGNFSFTGDTNLTLRLRDNAERGIVRLVQPFIYSDGNLDLNVDTIAFHNGFGENGGVLSVNGELVLHGKSSFHDSYATDRGGAVYADVVRLSDGGSSFVANGAWSDGGAIGSSGVVQIEGGVNEFVNNFANARGGAISAQKSVVISGGENSFYRNFITNYQMTHDAGGAIAALEDIQISGGTNTFDNNSSYLWFGWGNGGALDAKQSVVISDGNNTFTNNFAGNCGGAISTVNFSLAGGVNVFDSNNSWRGGAVMGYETTTLSGGTNTFTNNRAIDYGGAIYGGDTLLEGGTNFFSGNVAALGGAIKSHSIVNISGGTNTFFDNSVVLTTSGGEFSKGGAIFAAAIMLEGGTNNFFYNSAGYNGGALDANLSVGITGGENTFVGNMASWDGGAIYSDFIQINGGKNHFGSNWAGMDGGAIGARQTVDINGGENTFEGNEAGAQGGAIYGNVVNISGGTNTFEGNSAEQGGAIDASKVTIRAKAGDGNGDVTFKNNSAGWIANAVHVREGTYYNPSTLNIAAEEGRSVNFYDPITTADARFGSYEVVRLGNMNSFQRYELIVRINEEATDTGTVVFDGSLYAGEDAVHRTSRIGGDTYVGHGTFALKGAVTYQNEGYFLLDETATLSTDGFVNTIIANGLPNSPMTELYPAFKSGHWLAGTVDFTDVGGALNLIGDVALAGTVNMILGQFGSGLFNVQGDLFIREGSVLNLTLADGGFDWDQDWMQSWDVMSASGGVYETDIYGAAILGWDTLLVNFNYDSSLYKGLFVTNFEDGVFSAVYTAAVPEPGTLLILGLAVVAAPLARRFRRR